MDTTVTFAYQAPEIVETFDALDVLGSAEGLEVLNVGNGSTTLIISVAV